MSDHTIKATGRSVEGKGASRRLRHAASIPAIVYGGKSEPQPIQLDHEKIWLASQNEWFYSSILTLDVEGKTEQVLLRDMQRHPYKQLIMHLDFQRVDAKQAIKVAVPTLGQTVHLSELKLPKGVEIPELKLGKEHDVAVVVARQGRVETADAEEAEAAAAESAAAAAAVPAAKVEKDEE